MGALQIGMAKKLELTEKQIENQILSYLKMSGVLAFKIKTVGTFDPKLGKFRKPSPWYRKGISDILCCHNGKFIGLEVKARKGVVSPEQKLFIIDVQASGGEAYVVRSVEDVMTIFRDRI